MFIEPDKMLENCPKEIEKDLKEIVDLSEEFFDEVDISPNQHLREMKVDLEEAKEYLFLIINRFITLINESYIESEDESKETTRLSIALKMKFDEDVGSIMGELKKKPSEKLGGLGIIDLLKFSGDLKIAFDFLIYNPIIKVNNRQFVSISQYFKDIFTIVRASASTLGYEDKRISISKKMLPKPEDIISTLGKVNESKEIKKGEDALKQLKEDFEEKEDLEEDDESEDEEEDEE